MSPPEPSEAANSSTTSRVAKGSLGYPWERANHREHLIYPDVNWLCSTLLLQVASSTTYRTSGLSHWEIHFSGNLHPWWQLTEPLVVSSRNSWKTATVPKNRRELADDTRTPTKMIRRKSRGTAKPEVKSPKEHRRRWTCLQLSKNIMGRTNRMIDWKIQLDTRLICTIYHYPLFLLFLFHPTYELQSNILFRFDNSAVSQFYGFRTRRGIGGLAWDSWGAKWW